MGTIIAQFSPSSFQDTKAGATAVVALLRGLKLYIGWLGDSQAMLFRKGQAVEIMVPHKPDREVCLGRERESKGKRESERRKMRGKIVSLNV